MKNLRLLKWLEENGVWQLAFYRDDSQLNIAKSRDSSFLFSKHMEDAPWIFFALITLIS